MAISSLSPSSLSSLLLSFMSSSWESCIFELNDLQKWYENNCQDKEHSLKDLLDQLIKENKIKSRLVSCDEWSCDVYWPLPPATNSENTMPTLKRTHSQSLLESPGVPTKKRKSLNVSRPSDSTDIRVASVIAKEKKTLLGQLADKEKRLQKLRLVKLYRTKNNLDQLESLIDKWHNVSQDAAQTLLELSPVQCPPPSMIDLLNYLHIDPETIQYSIQDEAFY